MVVVVAPTWSGGVVRRGSAGWWGYVSNALKLKLAGKKIGDGRAAPRQIRDANSEENWFLRY